MYTVFFLTAPSASCFVLPIVMLRKVYHGVFLYTSRVSQVMQKENIKE